MNMEVIYCINARLGGGGIGNTALHAVRGSLRGTHLRRVICNSALPGVVPEEKVRSLGLAGRAIKKAAVLESSGTVNQVANRVFDWYSSRSLEPCTLLHCWSDLGRTLKSGREMGALTILECTMHPEELRATLEKESDVWGVKSLDISSSRQLEGYLSEFETAHFMTVPSEFNRKSHLARGVPEDKLMVVPYGVDLHRFRPRPQEPNDSPFRVIFVGQVSVLKGAPYLIEAWRQLGWHDAELWIAGRILKELSPLVDEWRSVPGLKLLGHRHDSDELMRGAHMFVFPSLGEGSALVTYEAMATGLPMIVTENAGSIAREGEAVFCVPGSVQTLADSMDRLRGDLGLRREISRNALERVRTFSWESYGDRLVEAYKHALKLRGLDSSPRSLD